MVEEALRQGPVTTRQIKEMTGMATINGARLLILRCGGNPVEYLPAASDDGGGRRTIVYSLTGKPELKPTHATTSAPIRRDPLVAALFGEAA